MYLELLFFLRFDSGFWCGGLLSILAPGFLGCLTLNVRSDQISVCVCVFACEGPEVDSDTRVVPFHQAGNMGEPTLLPSHTANGMTLQNPPASGFELAT